jgi:hypothetical protein
MISLISILNEILVKRKIPFNTSGTAHIIYQSRTNPDRLYKIGNRRIVETWYKIFKENPKYFPKVYRAGKITQEDEDKYYVEIEKLNTKRSIDEWILIEQTLEEIGHMDIDNRDSIDGLFNSIIPDKLKSDLKRHNIKVYNLFIKWISFLNEVEHIVQKNGKLTLDTHRYNFGYDSEGNMKCLDI